jgi:murein DD-endopeptidase MepM/ murein hydrolase activator NlpD
LSVLPALLVTLAAVASGPVVELSGEAIQGGLIVGRAATGSARVELDGRAVPVGRDGLFLLGFGRDAAPEAVLRVVGANGVLETRYLAVRQRDYPIQRIDGLPPSKVTPPPEVLERIRREADAVSQARARYRADQDFLDGFQWPAEARISGVYGSQRVLNGEPRQPHYGVDLALADGASVAAPADGVVVFAEPDLYYSGGTLIIDHGMGLSSSFLHLREILVAAGERVRRGQAVARAGATGRATGPHLDWRMNLGEERLDPERVLEALPAGALGDLR